MRIQAIFLLAIAIISAILLIQNTGRVKMFFLFWSGWFSLSLMLLLLFAAGVAVGTFLARRPVRSQKQRGFVRDVDNE